MEPWQTFETGEAMLARLADRVRAKGEVFSFRSDPLLASLVSCLGLEFELGKTDQDRSSALLGVNLERESWETRLITHDGLIGLLAHVPGRAELAPAHEDFARILHPLSLEEGRLSRIVIFPALVAEAYARRGIELVVVKDWALQAFLGEGELNYQRTNLHEIEQNIALQQMELIRERRLAFTGTHDLGDHLLGADLSGFRACDALLRELEPVYAEAFRRPSKRALVLSYLIAVMLDDLVQPQWYGSPNHLLVARLAMEELRRPAGELGAIFLPQAFHELVEELRSRLRSGEEIRAAFLRFTRELEAPWAAASGRRRELV